MLEANLYPDSKNYICFSATQMTKVTESSKE